MKEVPAQDRFEYLNREISVLSGKGLCADIPKAATWRCMLLHA